MKIYILCRLGYEYNDETYDQHGSSPKKAFHIKENALKECERLNKKLFDENKNSKYPMYNGWGKNPEEYLITKFYEVVEVDVEQDQILKGN